jgi:hypothetical protein
VGGNGLEVRRNARAGGWIETRDRQHDRGSHIHVIGQLFESLREKIAHRQVDRLRKNVARAGKSKCTRVAARAQHLFSRA